MGSFCDYHRTTKECIDDYVSGIKKERYEFVGVTGAWVKAIDKVENKPVACFLKMSKDEEGYVWYKPIMVSECPYYENRAVANWLKKEYKARGKEPEGFTKDWLDRCASSAAKAKEQRDKLKAFANSLEVGKRYPVKHAFSAGPYKFEVGDEFIYWGTLPKSKKRLSWHKDGLPYNFCLSIDLFIE